MVTNETVEKMAGMCGLTYHPPGSIEYPPMIVKSGILFNAVMAINKYGKYKIIIGDESVIYRGLQTGEVFHDNSVNSLHKALEAVIDICVSDTIDMAEKTEKG